MEESTPLLVVLQIVCYIVTAKSQSVTTSYGTMTGIRETTLGTKVDVYYGVPYAKPPIDLLRFKHPVPVEPWKPQVLYANTSKASCIQYIRRQPNPLQQLPPEVSEDCLYLNVFTPVSNETKIAVMVWLFGGGFTTGSIDSPMFDGRILSTVNDVIVVTVNYRLGVLGFLYLDSDTAPGNMGLMDQQLAIKWVYENIHNFGGDSNMITIFGQSAGAGCVSHHLLSPLSQPYFTSAIMESGSPLTSWDLLSDKEAKTFAIAIANKAKCTSVRTNADIYECLHEKSTESLVELQSHIAQGANVAFGPVVDGYFLPQRPLSILESGKMKNCSILLGVNKNEGALFLFYGHPSVFQWKNNLTITDNEFMTYLSSQARSQSVGTLTVNALYQEYLLSHIPTHRDYVSIADEILGDFSFKCPAVRFASFYSQASDVYLYSYNHRLSSARVPDWMGVEHAAELPLVWGHPFDVHSPLTFTPEEKDLSRKMMTYWSNFAKFGSPNGGSLAHWPQYENDDEWYIQLDVGSNLTTSQGLRRRQCVFLYQTVPIVASLENAADRAGSTAEPCSQPVSRAGTRRRERYLMTAALIATLALRLTVQ